MKSEKELMTMEDAIKQLEFDMDMITFDPMTGEVLSPEIVKLRNEDNYRTYLADQIAVQAMLKQMKRCRELEELEETIEPWQAQLFVRKAKTMPPVDKEDGFGNFVSCCPTCGNPVINYFNRKMNPAYCMMCGQKLEWREKGHGKENAKTEE